ncbi:unnamed protein product [Moneuplotes crassus]|uniref:Uncharacterized protein n=1 Tax=Euplotes crassus TaxID=5936 RepID=A0AAD1Y0A1_EUPCR|nr:unnamed protein product [Moneuplotes crassus]
MKEEETPDTRTLAVDEDGYVNKEILKKRLQEHAKTIKIRGAQGEYKGDNEQLEKKNKWKKRAEDLEEKYQNKPRIAFHTLTEEGNKKLMELKKERIWTTLGWSFIGNLGGVLGVSYFESNSTRWKASRVKHKREIAKVAIFCTSVAFFTYYGFAKARQIYVKGKLKLVEECSTGYSPQ